MREQIHIFDFENFVPPENCDCCFTTPSSPAERWT